MQEVLNATQLMYLESYRQGLVAERQAELQERIRAAIEEAGKAVPERQVTPLMKVRYRL